MESLLYPIENEFRKTKSLDGLWKFKLDPKNQGNKDAWYKGLEDAQTIPVPSSFNDFIEDQDYAGSFWYEKDVFITKSTGNKQIIRFSAVTDNPVVYFDGHEVYNHAGGFLPFEVDVTRYVTTSKNYKIVVKGSNVLSHESLPVGNTRVDADGNLRNITYFDFFNYAGLQRSVHLLSTPINRIVDFETNFEIDYTNNQAQVFVKLDADDLQGFQAELIDNAGHTVVKQSTEMNNLSLQVTDAHLWDVDDPYLYTLKLSLLNNNEVVDEYSSKIGIRTFESHDGKMFLNNQQIYLKGFGKHEDSEAFGRGTNLPQQVKDFKIMKEMGANSFRTSHYPYSEEVYYLADKIGMLIIDEGPFVGLQKLNNALLGLSTNDDFFELDTTYSKLLPYHKEIVQKLIKRDKNHPSVIMWSLFNEPDTTSESSVEYFEQVFDLARKEDPQKRLRTFTLFYGQNVHTSKTYKLADVISLNLYLGWYDFPGNELIDAKAALKNELTDWHNEQLGKPIIFTEYGADSVNGLTSVRNEMWTTNFQVEFLKMNHKIFDEFSEIQGEQVWNFADFKTSQGTMRVGGNLKGIFTRDRSPKPAAYYLKERWTEENKKLQK